VTASFGTLKTQELGHRLIARERRQNNFTVVMLHDNRSVNQENLM